MIRHTGQRRTYQHNLKLAILLSLTAGFVNAAGLLACAVLTTNVTGHAALLAIDLEAGNMDVAFTILQWLLLFLAGATFSSWYIGWMGKYKRYVYTVPLLIEFSILCLVATHGWWEKEIVVSPASIASGLLFAMGMQNALVTVISRAVVRTTHLTGILTDLGIALAETVHRKFKLNKSLKEQLVLRVNIILFFLAGGIAGAFFFRLWAYESFFIPSGIIVTITFYDAFKMRYRQATHRLFSKTAQ